MRKFRQSSVFLKERSARQAETLSKTLASDEARDRMRVAAKALWTPERHTQASAAITDSWAVKAVRRRRIKGIKTAWTTERREAQAAATAKIMAHPEMNARRLAGLRRANAEPELKALRIANLKKANARPGVLRRKIKKMKETLHTPEVNARRSATSKALWADLRAGRDALAKIAKPRRGRGAPRKGERTKRILGLRSLHPDWNRGDIAREMYPQFGKFSKKERERLRDAIRKVEERMERPKKQETPA